MDHQFLQGGVNERTISNKNDVSAQAEHIMLSLRVIYKRMDLVDKNYHNHAHNLAATYGMLLFLENDGTHLTKEMKKAAFLSALLHDFHIREKAAEGLQTAALKQS